MSHPWGKHEGQDIEGQQDKAPKSLESPGYRYGLLIFKTAEVIQSLSKEIIGVLQLSAMCMWWWGVWKYTEPSI